MKLPLPSESVAATFGLSEDVTARLTLYLDLLARWQQRINLVGGGTLTDPWRRHILDSLQLMPLLPQGEPTIADLGSGAGFPGLAIAIASGRVVHLLESDARKCAFLREAARVAGADVRIHARRIETMPPLRADVISARALAPLPRLIEYAAPHLAESGRCLFLKGKGVDTELTECAKSWMMEIIRTPSQSDPSATVLQLEAIRRRDDDRSRKI